MSVSRLLLSDGRFPAGGYAHSGGLEAAVGEGLGVEDVPLFLAGRLRGVAAPESRLAVAAGRAARRDELETLLSLDVEAEARCPSPPLRAIARRLGAQLLRSAAVVWPGGLIGRYRDTSESTPRPVAFGVVAAQAGLDDFELAQAYLYEDAATVAAAAVKLLPVDSATTGRWLVEAGLLLDRLAHEASVGTDNPRELPGGFAPTLELRSLAHEAREGRLFAS
ncbi:MAG: Urease accessory protein UreF [Thermoleophilia bacterium]|nr:Urease accessory protein UreF [Thermoleophilia bacterium]